MVDMQMSQVSVLKGLAISSILHYKVIVCLKAKENMHIPIDGADDN